MSKKAIIVIIIALVITVLSLVSIYVYVNYNNTDDVISKATIIHHRPKRISEGRILMFGRSVMAGWFNHWGSDTATPVKREGYILEYRELDAPPEIIESFKKQMDKLSTQERPIIFFKLCFTDFEGWEQIGTENNLARNEKYIEQVYEITKQKNLKLIIGNSLPQVEENATSYLKWNHLQFNQWLSDFKAKHPDDIIIFDMYNTLVGSLGSLKQEFAISSSDSHPNDAGYEALDKAFFTMLKANFKEE